MGLRRLHHQQIPRFQRILTSLDVKDAATPEKKINFRLGMGMEPESIGVRLLRQRMTAVHPGKTKIAQCTHSIT
jgi:hypothetical protein